MNSYKLVSFLTITILFLALCSGSAEAATKQDILDLVRQPFNVNGQVYYIENNYIIKMERFFNSHQLTSEQYDQILARIKEARNILLHEKTTDPTSMSWQAEHRLLRLIYEGGEIVDITIKYGKTDLNHGYLIFYEKDGRKIDEIYYKENNFKVTGTSYGVMGLGGLVLILTGITCKVRRRRLLALLD